MYDEDGTFLLTSTQLVESCKTKDNASPAEDVKFASPESKIFASFPESPPALCVSVTAPSKCKITTLPTTQLVLLM